MCRLRGRHSLANEVAKVEAGVQLAPNAARILQRIGVLEEIMEHVNILEGNFLRGYSDNGELRRLSLLSGVCWP